MSVHPEVPNGPLRSMLEAVDKSDVVSVKCQCGADAVVNKAYAKYISGPLSSCKECRA